jgi:hypothetical protein
MWIAREKTQVAGAYWPGSCSEGDLSSTSQSPIEQLDPSQGKQLTVSDKGRALAKRKEIIFVKIHPQLRIFKQALGLKKYGNYRLILLASRYDSSLFKDLFDEIHIFRTFSELASLLKKFKPYVFHAHAEPNQLPAFVKTHTDAPVVYDAYDLAGLPFGVESLPEEEREAEKFCMENTDGFVVKFGLGALDYYRGIGYRIDCPILHYGDYCAEELLAPIRTNGMRPSAWHLVYVGNVLPAKRQEGRYRHMLFHRLAASLNDQGVNFHIYANPYQYDSEEFQCYRDLARQKPLFHWHTPLHPLHLSREINKHHIGNQVMAAPVPGHLAPFTIGNKFPSYLEAGLPIIASSTYKHMAKLIKEMQVGVVIDNQADLDFIGDILEEAYHLDRGKMEQSRQAYCIANQWSRLAGFYEKVAGAKIGG